MPALNEFTLHAFVDNDFPTLRPIPEIDHRALEVGDISDIGNGLSPTDRTILDLHFEINNSNGQDEAGQFPFNSSASQYGNFHDGWPWPNWDIYDEAGQCPLNGFDSQY